MKEIRVAVIDTDSSKLEQYYEEHEDGITENIEDFVELAEDLGTVFSLHGFAKEVNEGELDNLTNSYIKFYIVDTDTLDIEEVISDFQF